MISAYRAIIQSLYVPKLVDQCHCWCINYWFHDIITSPVARLAMLWNCHHIPLLFELKIIRWFRSSLSDIFSFIFIRKLLHFLVVALKYNRPYASPLCIFVIYIIRIWILHDPRNEATLRLIVLWNRYHKVIKIIGKTYNLSSI